MGITVGCLVGMLPLLFYDHDDGYKVSSAATANTTTTAATATTAGAQVTRQDKDNQS